MSADRKRHRGRSHDEVGHRASPRTLTVRPHRHVEAVVQIAATCRCSISPKTFQPPSAWRRYTTTCLPASRTAAPPSLGRIVASYRARSIAKSPAMCRSASDVRCVAVFDSKNALKSASITDLEASAGRPGGIDTARSSNARRDERDRRTRKLRPRHDWRLPRTQAPNRRNVLTTLAMSGNKPRVVSSCAIPKRYGIAPVGAREYRS